MAVKPQVSIIALVDVIGALSDRSLLNGNLVMIDDGSFASRAQGTPDLCTIVQPGQVVQWTALAVDLQTPVEIKNIEFLRLQPPGQAMGQLAHPAPQPVHAGAQPAYAGAAAPPAQAAAGYGPGAFPPGPSGPASMAGAPTTESEKLDLEIWSGVVPYYMAPGVAYRYRLEFQMYEGPYSVLYVETPSLMRI